jgi:hypothetical protein
MIFEIWIDGKKISCTTRQPAALHIGGNGMKRGFEKIAIEDFKLLNLLSNN